MKTQFLGILILAVSAYAMPKLPKEVKKEIGNQISALLMPGPVLFPDNEVKAVHVEVSPQCEVCELLMKELDGLISQNSTKEEIEQALEQVCSYLPSSYKSECDDLVKEYAPQIIDALVNELSPDIVCKEIGLCSSKKSLLGDLPFADSTLCDMCLEIMGIAKKLIAENETEKEVEQTLKLICWYMLPVRKECDSFIDRFVPMVFEELKKLDPQTVCKKIQACPSQFALNDIRCYFHGQAVCDDPILAMKCGVNCKSIGREK